MSKERFFDMKARRQLHELTQSGVLFSPLENGAVRCHACGHRCFIPEGYDGVCKVRTNANGTLKVPYGYVAGLNVDPIEKKPFYHFLPGSQTLSFGMLGCDFRCRYCQNWKTSQALKDVGASSVTTPTSLSEIVEFARESKCQTVVSTYNEPLITSEWAFDIFKAAKEQGLRTAIVSNGNATPEVIDFLFPVLDAFKIDLKSFRASTYRLLGGVLQNVLESIEAVHKRGIWMELVTLVTPQLNDDPLELKELCDFVAGISKTIPVHFTAFHPDYKMRDRSFLPLSSLLRAGEIARSSGLKYVYLGNRKGQVGNFETTFCAGCGSSLIERDGFKVISNRLVQGACDKCSLKLSGIFI